MLDLSYLGYLSFREPGTKGWGTHKRFNKKGDMQAEWTPQGRRKAWLNLC